MCAEFGVNPYESAFESWLREHGVGFALMDERKRATLTRDPIKTFDYLLPATDGRIILAELKGRRFTGASFERLRGLECWVTADDVEGLAAWEEVFGTGHEGAFIFAYELCNVDVDTDGRELFGFDGRQYVFLAVRLADYRGHMKRRSPKWRTVTLPAAAFRQCALSVEELLLDAEGA